MLWLKPRRKFLRLGILILAGGLEGYLVMVGRLKLWSRPLLVVAGFLIAFPNWMITIIGALLTGLVIAAILVRRGISAKPKELVGGT